MLFMVIERFKNGDIGPVGERFKIKGRMLPAGVSYVTSWIDIAGAVCYQVMEADSPAQLQPWTECWKDLVDFEIVPILASADFWALRSAGRQAP